MSSFNENDEDENFYNNENPDYLKPKIILFGLRRSGKSSIQKVVFHKMSPNETLFLESTNKVWAWSFNLLSGSFDFNYLLDSYFFYRLSKKISTIQGQWTPKCLYYISRCLPLLETTVFKFLAFHKLICKHCWQWRSQKFSKGLAHLLRNAGEGFENKTIEFPRILLFFFETWPLFYYVIRFLDHESSKLMTDHN